MAEEQEEVAEEAAPEGGKSKKKLLIIIIAAVLLLGGIGGGAAFFLMGSGDKPETPVAQSSSEASGEGDSKDADGSESEDGASSGDEGEGEKEGEDGNTKDKKDKETEGASTGVNFGATYTFKPFHLNLGNPLENRYLRLEIAVEFKQGETQKQEIEARLPQLRDAVIAVASRKTREFLLGPDGKDQLRLEILTRINQYMDMKIESVFITDLLIE